MALAGPNGAVQTSYGCDPYGVANVSGTTSDSPYQFTGRDNDGAGLYFYCARLLQPGLGTVHL